MKTLAFGIIVACFALLVSSCSGSSNSAFATPPPTATPGFVLQGFVVPLSYYEPGRQLGSPLTTYTFPLSQYVEDAALIVTDTWTGSGQAPSPGTLSATFAGPCGLALAPAAGTVAPGSIATFLLGNVAAGTCTVTIADQYGSKTMNVSALPSPSPTPLPTATPFGAPPTSTPNFGTAFGIAVVADDFMPSSGIPGQTIYGTTAFDFSALTTPPQHATLVVAEPLYQGAFTAAASCSPSPISVVPAPYSVPQTAGGSTGAFVITETGHGSCGVTVNDSLGHSGVVLIRVP